MSTAIPTLHNIPNNFVEGVTLLQGPSSATYFHLVSPKALEDESSTFYKLAPAENQQENPRVFIETSNNDTIFAIYRQHFPSNNPNEPMVRYMSGSLVELSSSERKEITQKALNSKEDSHSDRSN